MVSAGLWMWGLTLISPPAMQITEVSPAPSPPPPAVKKPVQRNAAAKKVEQPKQATVPYFW